MKTIFFILILLLLGLTSCFNSHYPQTNKRNYSNTNPEKILIFSKHTSYEYEIISLIGIDVTGDAEVAIEHLKKKASKIGAQAIIHLKLSNKKHSSTHTHKCFRCCCKVKT